MRFAWTMKLLLVLSVLSAVGCEPSASTPPKVDPSDPAGLAVYCAYAPTSVDLLPLTRIAASESGVGDSEIRAYVAMLDAFTSQVKAPGVVRFELYEYLQRSAERKGKRIMKWDDVDLNDPTENNALWRDFLRAYEFPLAFKPHAGRHCVLQVTVITPNDRRLTAEYLLLHP